MHIVHAYSHMYSMLAYLSKMYFFVDIMHVYMPSKSGSEAVMHAYMPSNSKSDAVMHAYMPSKSGCDAVMHACIHAIKV